MPYRPYRNTIMNELMVPWDLASAQRIHGFYDAIGWDVRSNSKTDREILASPDVDAFVTPTIAYWQTDNTAKTDLFFPNEEPDPSEFAVGLRLPYLHQIVEIVLLVPTDDYVHDLFDRGGPILHAHAHQPPREHAGVREFRFSDPFNYSLRVASNPGYEVNLPTHPLAGKQIDHNHGSSYVIEEEVPDATGYERTGRVNPTLLYTKIAGGADPLGTRYTRTEEELVHGTMPEDPETPIFEMRED